LLRLASWSFCLLSIMRPPPMSTLFPYTTLFRSQQSVDEMVDAVLKLEEGARFQVLAPVVRQRKGTQQKELEAARRAGYTRVKVDGSLYDLDEEITLEKNIKIGRASCRERVENRG